MFRLCVFEVSRIVTMKIILLRQVMLRVLKSGDRQSASLHMPLLHIDRVVLIIFIQKCSKQC